MTPHVNDAVGVELSIFFTRKFLDVGLKFVSGEQVGIDVQVGVCRALQGCAYQNTCPKLHYFSNPYYSIDLRGTPQRDISAT